MRCKIRTTDPHFKRSLCSVRVNNSKSSGICVERTSFTALKKGKAVHVVVHQGDITVQYYRDLHP